MALAHTMRAVTLALLIAAGIAACAAQSMSAEEEEMLEEMGVKGTPMGRKDQTPKAEVIKSDLKYIRCEVCRMGVAVAYEKARSILEKRFKYQKKRKNEAVEFDGEEAVQDFVEAMCDSDKPEGPGAWIRHLDLVASGDRLEVREHAGYGHCERECRTIERACEEFVDAADTDFTEILYEAVRDGTELEKVQRLVCNRAAGVCKKKAPPLPPGRKDYAFRAMSDDEKQMNDMCAPSSRRNRTRPRARAAAAPREGRATSRGACARRRRRCPQDGQPQGLGDGRHHVQARRPGEGDGQPEGAVRRRVRRVRRRHGR